MSRYLRRGLGRGLAVFLCCLVASAVFGGDGDWDGAGRPVARGVTGPVFADLFDAAAARRPAAGEWLEYRVAFALDPLMNSLSPHPVPPPETATAGARGWDDGMEYGYGQPPLDPEIAWRAIPVRLEVREADERGYRVVLVYEGAREELYLSAAGNGDGAEFLYDDDGGGPDRATLRIGGVEYAVEETRRSGAGYGFVRWFSPEAPFGVMRFATEYVDMTLVGWGDDARSAPEFPLRVVDPIKPPPGRLYRSGE